MKRKRLMLLMILLGILVGTIIYPAHELPEEVEERPRFATEAEAIAYALSFINQTSNDGGSTEGDMQPTHDITGGYEQTRYEYSDMTGFSSSSSTIPRRICQTYLCENDEEPISFQIYGARSSSSGSYHYLFCNIYDTYGDWKAGTNIVDTSFVDTGEWSTSFQWRTFQFLNACTLYAGTTYYFDITTGYPFGTPGPNTNTYTFRYAKEEMVETETCRSIQFAKKDTYVKKDDPNSNFGTLEYMKTRNEYILSWWGGYEWQALLQFDLWSISWYGIEDRAMLSVYYAGYEDNNPVGRKIGAYRNTGSWSETSVTWNTKPGMASRTSYGTVPSTSGRWMDIDVSSDVYKFKTGTTNYGWSLRDYISYDGLINIPIAKFYSQNSVFKPRLYLYDVAVVDRPNAYEGGKIYYHYQASTYTSDASKDLAFKVLAERANDPPEIQYFSISTYQQDDPGWYIVDENSHSITLYEDVLIKKIIYFAIDPNGCPVRYRFDWEDNGVWTSWSGETTTPQVTTHFVDEPGGHSFVMQAKDHHDALSYIECLHIGSVEKSIYFIERPPEVPTKPTGDGTYAAETEECFQTYSYDYYDHEDIRFICDWGDGEITTSPWYSSPATATLCHTWRYAGTYDVRIQAEDTEGAKSEWSATETIVIDTAPPTVSTLDAMIYSPGDVTLRGIINSDGGDQDGCDVGFRYSSTSTSVNDGETVWTDTGIQSGRPFGTTLSTVGNEGVLFYYKAIAKNDASSLEIAHNAKWFLPAPQPVTFASAYMESHTSLFVMWGNGQGGKGVRIEWRCTTTGRSGVKEVIGTSCNITGLDPGYYTLKLYGIAQDNIGSTWQTSNGENWAPYASSVSCTAELLYPPVIEIRNATLVETNVATLNAYLAEWGGDLCTVWFEYGTGDSYPLPNTTPPQSGIADKTAVSAMISSMTPGERIVFRAKGENIKGVSSSNYSVALTKPEGPGVLTVKPDDNNTMNITWINGAGGDGMYIEYANDTAPSPWNIGDGIPANGNGFIYATTFLHEHLEQNKTFHYKIWPFAEDRGYRSDNTTQKPFGTPYTRTNATRLNPILSDIREYNVTNNSAEMGVNLSNSGVNSTVWFEWGESPTTMVNTTTPETMAMGSYTRQVFGLKVITRYYYRVHATNYNGETISSTYSFYTCPNPPRNFSLVEYGPEYVLLSWDAGEGGDSVSIWAQYGNYTTAPGEGRLVITTSAYTHTDRNFSTYVDIHYTAWSYNATAQRYSTTAAQVTSHIFDYEVYLPKYISVGDYVISWGKINSRSNQPVVGFQANTSVLNATGHKVLGPVLWNCVDGNYQTTIPTTQLPAGRYTLRVRFINNLGTRLNFNYESPLYVSKEIESVGGGIYSPATVHYTFYDIGTGAGLDDNMYKVYISYDDEFSSGDRVKGGTIQTLRAESETLYLGNCYYIQIRDYTDNIIPLGVYDAERLQVHNHQGVTNAYASFEITYPEFYIDVGVYLNQLRIKNMNASTVYVVVRRTDGNPGQILGRFIPPWEETEVFIPDGTYNLTVDHYTNAYGGRAPTNRTYPWGEDIYITRDHFAWIPGTSFDDVMYMRENAEAWIYYTLVEQNSGRKISDDAYPIYISDDDNITEDDRVRGGRRGIMPGQDVYVRVTDYWGSVIYPTNDTYATITCTDYKTFLDVMIPLHQLLILNANESTVYIQLTNGNRSDPANATWYGRWICSEESSEIFLRTGRYNITIEHYHTNGSLRKREYVNDTEIDKDSFNVIAGQTSRVYVTIYQASTGLHIDTNDLKIYIDNVRLTGKYIDTYKGSNHQITIKNYYDQILYNGTFQANEYAAFLDVTLPLYYVKFMNMKPNYFIVASHMENMSRAWEKTIGAYETIDFVVTGGWHTFHIYNATETIYNETLYINETKGYVIYTNNTRTIVNVIERSTSGTLHALVDINWEEYNLSDPRIREIIGVNRDLNETANELEDEFQKNHILDIPQLGKKQNDVEAPQSTIAAVIALNGDIRITWNSVDDTGLYAVSTNISYRKGNATAWKYWVNDTNPYGSLTFTDEMEQLQTGETYSFRALSRDPAGNAEVQNRINVVEVSYGFVSEDVPWTAEEIAVDAAQQWTFILAIIGLIGIVGIVVFMGGKKEKEKKDMASQTSHQQMRWGRNGV